MRVVFGAGRRSNAAAELERLGARRALLLSTPEQEGDVRALAETLGPRAAGLFAGAAMHTPTDVTERAMTMLGEVRADAVLAMGGGSTIGLAKAIALRTDLAQLAIPTTFAGSEMTPIIGQTEAGRKTTQTTRKVLPETVIYDADLVRTLPAAVAGPSAMNAIAHAVEALYAEDGSPVISLMAEEAIRAIGGALPAIMERQDPAALEQALYGAWLAGACLGSVGMAIHHKICHVLGGSFGLPHAPIHCLMIPYSAHYNAEAAPRAMDRVARALGADDAPAALHDLMRLANAQTRLSDFGLTEGDLDEAAAIAVEQPYWNPRPVTRGGVREMLHAAWEGRAP
ncbi:MAG: maleylacetate reductase [Pseudomonadota bacterium]